VILTPQAPEELRLQACNQCILLVSYFKLKFRGAVGEGQWNSPAAILGKRKMLSEDGKRIF
jgi:hypothetical protein